MKQSTLVSSALAAFTVLAGFLPQAKAQPVPLGTTSSFAVLAGSGITIAGAVNSSAITGDIGTFPTATITGIGNVVLIGVNHAGDAVTQAAKTDLVTAYNNAAGRGAATVATELGGTTKAPGVYDSASTTFTLTGILTLDAGGDPNAVFVFKMGSTLTTASSSEVKLINGAQAGNVYWQVGSSATLGSSSIFKGNVLALTAITLGTGATIDGRMLARNSFVQLDGTNTIRLPVMAQTIAFAPIPSHTACDAPFTFVLPTATSGLPVTLAVTGPATLSGNTVTLTGAVGTVAITASQAGNATFSAAPNVTQSFSVTACALVPQTILFAPIPGHTACDAPFTFVFPTASSGLPVTVGVSGPATVSGNTVTLTGAVGTVILTASQAGNGVFAAAPNVTQSFAVVACALVAQTITFAPLAGHTACDAPFSFVFPFASSGLAVSVAVSGPATVSGNVVTLTGAVGTVVLTATQPGNGVFSAAPSVTQSFVVAACALTPQTITFAPIPGHTACDTPFSFVLPTASSGLPVTLAVSGPATVSGNTVTLTGAIGTVVLTASQGGNGTFSAASNVAQSFVVVGCVPAPTAQTITFAPISGHTACDTPFSFVFPTASSGLPVTLAVSGPATVSGNTVTLTGAVGTVILTASQAGNGTYAPASNVAQSFVVTTCTPAPTPQTITFDAIPGHSACDAPFTFVAPVASSGLPVTLAVSGPATVSGNTVTLTGAVGTVVITATQAGSTTFAAAPSATQSFAVGACGSPPVITSPFDVQSNGQPVAPNFQLGTVGATFAGYQITATGSPTSFGAINLPPGLAVNALTGAITGTPTVADTWFVTVRATNDTGVGDAVVIFVIAPVGPASVPPIITSANSAPGVAGSPFVTFGITAAGSPTSYSATGLPAGLILNPVTGAISGTPTVAGTYAVTLSATNASGTSTSALTISIAAGPSSRIVNFSARALSGTGDQSLIMGFVVSGNGKNLLVRGIGPTLANFGVANVLADPFLTLFNATGAVATNDDWQTNTSGPSNGPQIAAMSTQVGAFALPTGSKDSSLLVVVNGGAYTTSLLRPSSTAGVALTEIYDTDVNVDSRLINVSARMNVTTGEGALIVGLVIAGDAPKTVLIRGVGPTLSVFGVIGLLIDPTITVFSGSSQIGSNDNWGTGGSTAAQITAASAQVGAFALTAGSRDAALLLTLQPGAYTVLLTGVGNTTGAALVEVYDTQ